jgi:hypothetical protein
MIDVVHIGRSDEVVIVWGLRRRDGRGDAAHLEPMIEIGNVERPRCLEVRYEQGFRVVYGNSSQSADREQDAVGEH